jgi:hypothetical protein
MHVPKKGNNNKKRLTYTEMMRPIFEYGAVCWDPYREGQVSALNRLQKRAAGFANNTNENLAQHRLIGRIATISRETGLESDKQ